MAIETGTATNYLDLMAKLRDFLTTDTDLVADGQEWECIAGKTTGTPIDTDFMSFKGQGLGGTDEIFFSITPVATPANNYYNLAIYGHAGYNSGTPGVIQPGNHYSPVTMLLTNLPIVYWFVANGRRVIIITRISGRYDCAYIGLLLPDHLPEDWTYPLFVGGSSFYTTDGGATSDLAPHTNFWNPYCESNDMTGRATAYVFAPGGVWRALSHLMNGGSSQRNIGMLCVPWCAGIYPQNLRRTVDDQSWIKRGQVASVAEGAGLYSGGIPSNVNPNEGQWLASFDGVFYTPAFGASAEQIQTESGVDHMMIPNIARTGDGRWAAIAME